MALKPLRFETKVDIVALTALLFSIGHIAFDIFMSSQPADIRLFAPRKIVIVFDRYGIRCNVRFSSVMTYVNNSRRGRNGLVTLESMRYSIGKDDYTQHWQMFIRSDSKKADNQEMARRRHCVKNDKDQNLYELTISDTGLASPFVVEANNGVSHETYFAPNQRNCEGNKCKFHNFIEDSEFKELIALENGQKPKSIIFTFVAKIVGYDDETASCKVTFDSEILGRLETRGWAPARCWAVEVGD